MNSRTLRCAPPAAARPADPRAPRKQGPAGRRKRWAPARQAAPQAPARRRAAQRLPSTPRLSPSPAREPLARPAPAPRRLGRRREQPEAVAAPERAASAAASVVVRRRASPQTQAGQPLPSASGPGAHRRRARRSRRGRTSRRRPNTRQAKAAPVRCSGREGAAGRFGTASATLSLLLERAPATLARFLGGRCRGDCPGLAAMRQNCGARMGVFGPAIGVRNPGTIAVSPG